jgi:hypothetical protein
LALFKATECPRPKSRYANRVAIFFLMQLTRTGKIYQMAIRKIYQIAVKNTIWP